MYCKLVYLDAAHDRRRTADITLSDPACPPFFRRLLLEVAGSPNAAQIVISDMPALDEWERYKAIMKAMTTFPTDYTQVRVPALAFYAMPENHQYIPSQATEKVRKSMNDWWVKKWNPIHTSMHRKIPPRDAAWSGSRDERC